MKTSTKTKAAAAALIALTAFGAERALANDWTRSGPNGSVTRSVDGQGGATVDRNGANGASTSATIDCARQGLRANCSRDYSATNANGETVSGVRDSVRGPFRGRSVNTVTGPDGGTRTVARPTRRYNRADPGFRGRRPGLF